MFMCQCKICNPQDGIFKTREKQFEQTRKGIQCTYQLSNLDLVISRSSVCIQKYKKYDQLLRDHLQPHDYYLTNVLCYIPAAKALGLVVSEKNIIR